MFEILQDNLKKILLDLEKYYAIQRIPEGIVLNKELYEKSQKQILGVMARRRKPSV